MPDEKIKLLIVDDEPDLCKPMEMSLSRRGYEVTIAIGGEAGLAALRAGEYPLLICDLKMPRVDGYDVLKEAKKLYPDIKVLMVTGFEEDGSEERCMALGADKFVLKPIRIDKIRILLEELYQSRGKV